MKRRLLINRILALLVCGTMCVSCMMPAAAAPAEAEKNTEIQLIKVRGNVTVVNGSGREIPYAVDMAPDNGDHVKTQESSYLWLNLGDGNTAKMDACSGAEFRTSGSKKEILLDEGSLYFNLSEEDMNIRTMTAALNMQNACGWIRAVDREHTLICILSGEGACSVTDPISGQVRSEALNSGDLAECLVYPQDHEGDKCDIILRRFEEDDVAGFVLTELAEEPPLLEQIAEAADVDLSSQAEAAQSRLQEEENALQQKLDELNGQAEQQENNIAKDPTWAGAMEKEEDPFPVPGLEAATGEKKLPPFPSISPAVPLSEPENVLDKEPDLSQAANVVIPSEPEDSLTNEPEPGRVESAAAPSEPVTDPGSASSGPDNSLVVKGIFKNQRDIRVGKDGQAVFKNAFTNTSSYCWIENEGQITFESDLNNEDYAYITNKAQLTARGDIYNNDNSCIENKGQITAEKNVYNGIRDSWSSIVTRETGSQFNVAGEFFNGNAGLYISDGTISKFEQSDGDVEICGAETHNDGAGGVSVENGYVITGGRLDMSAGTLEAGTSAAALTVNISGSDGDDDSEDARISGSGGVSISGGTIFGNGDGKAAISAVSGNIIIGLEPEELSLSDEDTEGPSTASVYAEGGGSPYGPAAVKAYNIFDTIRSDGNNWNAVMYHNNHLGKQYLANADSPVYLGREEGNLVYLGCVSGSFSDVAEYADHGDIITLKDDVYDDVGSCTVNGSEATLDLNGKQLEANIDFENASWVINGEGENKEPGSFVGTINNYHGNMEITCSVLNGEVKNEGGGLKIDNIGVEEESPVWFDMVSGSLDLSGGNYKYSGNDSDIILIKGGNLNLRDGVRLKGVEGGGDKDIAPIIIFAVAETHVTIGNAVIDGVGYPALVGRVLPDEEGAVSFSIGKEASISSKSDMGTVYFLWEEGKCSLNLNGGKIVNEFAQTAAAINLVTIDGNSNIPPCLSEIRTELKSVPKKDQGDIAVWISCYDGNGVINNVSEYTTVWDENGNCWRLELIDPDIGKASEASIMNGEADLPEDEEITEPETNETLEAENPEESKDPEDEENPDESKDPSESEDPSEPKDPSGSEDPKKPAEGGGDESGSGDKETPPGGGDEGGSGDKETPPGSGDVLPPENAGDKKEEEPVKDKGAGKEGEAAREQSE